MSGYPTGRTGDRGDRKKFYVQKFYVPFLLPISLDEGQITHLICARLKYDQYDFFRGCFGAFLQEKNRKQAQNTPKKVI